MEQMFSEPHSVPGTCWLLEGMPRFCRRIQQPSGYDAGDKLKSGPERDTEYLAMLTSDSMNRGLTQNDFSWQEREERTFQQS